MVVVVASTLVSHTVLARADADWPLLMLRVWATRHQSVGIFTCGSFPLHTASSHIERFARHTNSRSHSLLRVLIHTPGESILKAHAVRHVLVL